ncbi:endonuclease/exonuclease/phosphatase family protein [Paraglaciecola sp. 2405UD69-4]|uniref:endonuclease/exonuclease/phosphatase family protein n=1 Tax=Paraglaciecola sp. 2405UD69-4 TaxID=3391836 RepID=UPI0039C8FE66
MFNRITIGLYIMVCLAGCHSTSTLQNIRVATFNVSMEAGNYVQQGENVSGNELSIHLASGGHSQIQNIAEIIQRNKPDIILLNEFDYLSSSVTDIRAFIDNYLSVPQNGSQAAVYPYFYSAPVNTGLDSGLDLDKDGVASGSHGDAFGFGAYPGQYGMLVLSKFPILKGDVRTFQTFLWKDMPNNLLTSIKDESGEAYFNQAAQNILRLSSKSHWDIPIDINGVTLNLLASHPTPPVFDGPENRNGKRNHDEIRFWTDYISDEQQAAYIYDDLGAKGGFSGKHFVIVGDLNASPVEGDGEKAGIQGLLSHPRVNDSFIPESEGAKLHTINNSYAGQHTAFWRMRADYVLPSNSLGVLNSGVFWPTKDDLTYKLIKDRKSSSDHRLVWVDIKVKP